jgi:hypothetical protein
MEHFIDQCKAKAEPEQEERHHGKPQRYSGGTTQTHTFLMKT